ncbi:unnamed protein product [Effrenium voratum]|nr:unnamed protein product [Effrenium voratum]|mmetsp:Transcript_355/g.697  ORF Transcript_355/g.697 Transcript_355/m.697 type:complete len:322 (-) Transcript_355:230-1195(-)|eukprot:CAMPEP_0181441276 /NCGR_PEP_ID=MMETSP1110-20121109/23424_1 /TAXON_ID=174948 /ORGANISM="Symbiodinium sp., Strain CCMP421" /LENGTH=321 /DNA_ID=CAMNT_0023565155 /DNA_START=91 /DNA_END=1056 /DNA_ORIENTATION=+
MNSSTEPLEGSFAGFASTDEDTIGAGGKGQFSSTLASALLKFGRSTSCGSHTTSAGTTSNITGKLCEATESDAGTAVLSQDAPSPLAGRTTVMVKYVPIKYTQRKLLREFLSAGFQGKMDFIYLPMDPRSRCSRGFAFCNFQSPEVAQQFYRTFHRKFLKSYESEMALEVAAAEIQGFEANAEHYLDVKASRKDKGRDTFGCPTFLRPLPKYLLAQLRQVEDASPDSKRIDARGLGLLRPEMNMGAQGSERRVQRAPFGEPKVRPQVYASQVAFPEASQLALCSRCGRRMPNSFVCHTCGHQAISSDAHLEQLAFSQSFWI